MFLCCCNFIKDAFIHVYTPDCVCFSLCLRPLVIVIASPHQYCMSHVQYCMLLFSIVCSLFSNNVSPMCSFHILTYILHACIYLSYTSGGRTIKQFDHHKAVPSNEHRGFEPRDTSVFAILGSFCSAWYYEKFAGYNDIWGIPHFRVADF